MTFLLRFVTFVLLVCVNSPTFATLYKCIFVKLDDYETMDNDGRRVSFVDTCFSFSQTLWVTSLDSIDLDKSVADLKDCYAVEFLLETPAAEELPVDIYLSDIRKRDLRELQLEEPSHVRKVCLTARSLGKKRQVLTVPIKAFDTPMASEGTSPDTFNRIGRKR